MNRLTIVNPIYYEGEGFPTFEFDGRYETPTKTAEQVYQRVEFASEEWKPLGTGWLNSTSCLIIKNDQQLGTQRIPGQVEKNELAQHVLEIRLSPECTNPILLSPRESFRLRPEKLEGISIRSRYKLTKFVVSVIPE